ncbi:MAG: hypothetical protein JST39_19380, partial [Bacteroidetes bacterium]|nr:hypothetical protein [Bacteroidota bacterium]
MKKNIALLCYLTWIGWIIAFILNSTPGNSNSYTRFHLRQSFGLGLLVILVYLLFSFVGLDLVYFSIPSLLVFVVFFILWMIGFKSAMDEKEKP